MTKPIQPLRCLLLRDGIPWFGRHTGYEQYTRYLGTAQPAEVITPRAGKMVRYLGSSYARLQGRMGRGATDFSEQEFRLRRRLQHSDVSHILYLEHHLELLNVWSKAPKDVVGTIHLPASVWKPEQCQLLARLSSDRRREFHLVMAGPDDHAYGREMKALVASLGLAERVTWTGMLSGDLKWGAFHASDAFVLTSHQENFGIAVVEALACGVPVLISSQVNIWREIRQAGAGFVESDDAAGAQRLLEQWIQVDGALWQRMREAARKVFAERFEIERAAVSFIDAMRIHGLRSANAA